VEFEIAFIEFDNCARGAPKQNENSRCDGDAPKERLSLQQRGRNTHKWTSR
jgi:hypothetical protein